MNSLLAKNFGLLLTAVALVLYVSGCAPKPESEMKALTKSVKANVNSTNLQAWATSILKTNAIHSVIDESGMPPDLRRLRSQGFQLQPDILESNCVVFVCWKTFKFFGASTSCFYGIRVGPPTFVPTENLDCYTNWMPGIYFWYDRTMM